MFHVICVCNDASTKILSLIYLFILMARIHYYYTNPLR